MPGPRYESLTDRKVWTRALRHLRKNDKTLAGTIGRLGSITPNWGPADPYEAIVDAFIYQQIAGNAADAILKRFKALYNGRLPTPREFLRTPEKKVRGAGVSPQKYSYIKDLCERLMNKELDLDGLAKLPDEEIIAILDDVRGIGKWTAEMFLMFSLHRVNVFPLDDLGMQNGMRNVYGIRGKLIKERMMRIANSWEPYKSVGTLYMWRSND